MKNKHDSRVAASHWVDSDPFACRQDVEWLGLAEAAKFNKQLADLDEDPVWHGIALSDMYDALDILTESDRGLDI